MALESKWQKDKKNSQKRSRTIKRKYNVEEKAWEYKLKGKIKEIEAERKYNDNTNER